MSLPRSLYFAYASNMLSRRMLRTCPEAEFVGRAYVENHALRFWNHPDGPSTVWQGATATIVPKQGSIVFGAVWSFLADEDKGFDKVEGVLSNVYERRHVIVKMDGSYRITELQPFTTALVEHNSQQIDCLPSPHYVSAIKAGAKECELPALYQKQLCGIKDNGRHSDIPIMAELGLAKTAAGKAQTEGA